MGKTIVLDTCGRVCSVTSGVIYTANVIIQIKKKFYGDGPTRNRINGGLTGDRVTRGHFSFSPFLWLAET